MSPFEITKIWDFRTSYFQSLNKNMGFQILVFYFKSFKKLRVVNILFPFLFVQIMTDAKT